MSAIEQMLLLPHDWRGRSQPKLVDEYKRAFARANELYIVSAFLTEWPEELLLGSKCRVFKMVIGTDFGTTRRGAVEAVLQWLPARFNRSLLAFSRRGVSFHPKAVLWRERGDAWFILVGSSNLTRAAFASNVEANVTLRLEPSYAKEVLGWFDQIADCSVEVDASWLRRYKEAPIANPPLGRGESGSKAAARGEAVFDLNLSLPDKAARKSFEEHLAARRRLRRKFDAVAKRPIIQSLRAAAKKKNWDEQDNRRFYDRLLSTWASGDTRMGGLQWVMRGKHANHQELARAVVAILDAPPSTRDDEVVAQIDRLQGLGLATRGAVLSELLCHLLPKRYPLLDQPVRQWRSRVGFDKGNGGTEGERYRRLARAMRAALRDPYVVELGLDDLAELDTLIWCHETGRQR